MDTIARPHLPDPDFALEQASAYAAICAALISSKDADDCFRCATIVDKVANGCRSSEIQRERIEAWTAVAHACAHASEIQNCGTAVVKAAEIINRFDETWANDSYVDSLKFFCLAAANMGNVSGCRTILGYIDDFIAKRSLDRSHLQLPMEYLRLVETKDPRLPILSCKDLELNAN